jgi:hypothetical protein
MNDQATIAPVVLGYTLQPVTCALQCILEEIGSPFPEQVQIVIELQDKPTREIVDAVLSRLKPSTTDYVATAFCFVTDIDMVEKLLEAHGKAGFFKYVMREFGRQIHPLTLGELNAAIFDHYIYSLVDSIKQLALSRRAK